MNPDGSDLRVITSGPGIHEIPSWSPSGRRIVFGYSPESDPSTPSFETRLWTMRADGSRARPLRMRRPGFDLEPRYSPDGTRILFMCETQGTLLEPPEGHNEDICVANADGSNVVNLTKTPDVFENWPSWGPAPR